MRSGISSLWIQVHTLSDGTVGPSAGAECSCRRERPGPAAAAGDARAQKIRRARCLSQVKIGSCGREDSAEK